MINLRINQKEKNYYISTKIYYKKRKLKLPLQKKICVTKNRRKKSIKEKRIRRLGGKSIEQRAQIINNREEIGHFEMDTVIGKRENSSFLLVLTDRKSRFEIIRKLNSKTTKEVR